jgi:hypothetical protein
VVTSLGRCTVPVRCTTHHQLHTQQRPALIAARCVRVRDSHTHADAPRAVSRLDGPKRRGRRRIGFSRNSVERGLSQHACLSRFFFVVVYPIMHETVLLHLKLFCVLCWQMAKDSSSLTGLSLPVSISAVTLTRGARQVACGCTNNRICQTLSHAYAP